MGLLVDPEAGWVSKLGSAGFQGPQQGLCRPCLPFAGLTPAAAITTSISQVPLPLAL